ncbi:hypothetical protein HU230_0012550 [Bradyrhizobium quebecense]|uniref:Uncharacterized protein n=1 Tax=Bradyrhizobium quebecense TaxID=2748629 RepID=A0A973WR93_9BRAD|nr:hypothetical protein [Bradyrhizobium quebecense]UGA46819.1 hypothetical protein HU230_0012550 [Bradyrhizobium quebecense]
MIFQAFPKLSRLSRGCTDTIDNVMQALGRNGSIAVPGFKNPEGIVIWHSASRVSFKKTFDDNHKEAA